MPPRKPPTPIRRRTEKPHSPPPPRPTPEKAGREPPGAVEGGKKAGPAAHSRAVVRHLGHRDQKYGSQGMGGPGNGVDELPARQTVFTLLGGSHPVFRIG